MHRFSEEERLKMVKLAQLVRASDCGSEGRGFEPHTSPPKFPNSLEEQQLRLLFLQPFYYLPLLRLYFTFYILFIKKLFLNFEFPRKIPTFVPILITKCFFTSIHLYNMSELNKEPTDELIIAISSILLENGMKATTMDYVAATLSMSKRTLYEIFDSKKDMILKVVNFWHKQRQKKAEAIFASSKTVMEALIRAFQAHQKMMKEVNLDFFLDMDRHYPEVRKVFEDHDKVWVDKIMEIINKGMEQGVFRTDVNYNVTLHLMRLQMESLKRMEEVFPPNITITDAFDTISKGFLRSIATPKGMEIIDSLYNKNSEL